MTGRSLALMYKLIQVLSILAALVGTYLLAFGLKIQPGISDELRKELKVEEKGLVCQVMFDNVERL